MRPYRDQPYGRYRKKAIRDGDLKIAKKNHSYRSMGKGEATGQKQVDRMGRSPTSYNYEE
jgi:hypothetical protein